MLKKINNNILESLFEYLSQKKKLGIIKYNKKIQKALNISINDYKEYELEIIKEKNKESSLIQVKNNPSLWNEIIIGNINRTVINNISFPKYPLKSIVFRIVFDSKFGENVCILGSIPELGLWNLNGALFLKWNEGNIWNGEIKIERNLNYFEFKYAIEENNKIKIWQPGENNKINFEELIGKFGINNYGKYNNVEFVYILEKGTLLINFCWPSFKNIVCRFDNQNNSEINKGYYSDSEWELSFNKGVHFRYSTNI